MKRYLKTIMLLVIVFLITILAVVAVKKKYEVNENAKKQEKTSNEKVQTEYSKDIQVLATLEDEITKNSAWCGTFQLVWNDMQDEVVKQDIVFQKQLEIVENLNKQTFKESDISEEYYYKKFGLMTLKLKEEIETGIQEKFNEPSDILDMVDWSGVPEDDSGYGEDEKTYLFYVMLFREFNFEKEFTELENDVFKGSEEEYEDVKYFGINYESSEELFSQVDVLYYNSEEDFAVLLNTKEGDEVILSKGENGNTYSDIYNSILEKEEEYTGKKYFTENDTLKVPTLDLDVLREYDELVAGGNPDKMFYDSEGDLCEISKAIQTIKFSLDKSGGKIKSEALIVMKENAVAFEPEEIEYRYFEFDSEFNIFLRESGKDLPYFAANIDNIKLFQK